MTSLSIAIEDGTRNNPRQDADIIGASEASDRRVEHQFVDIVEAERRRLGSEFHDGLGQRLTSLALSAAILSEKLDMANRPEVSDARRLVAQTNEAVAEARSLVRGLYPAWLVRNGLEATLSELLGRIEQVSKRTTQLVISEDWQPVIEPDEAMHVFRIVQEAVNNALKHSECDTISVRLEKSDERRRVVVSDNGKGLPERETLGFGFRLMRYRAELLGALITIGSHKGHGTAVELTLESGDPSHQDLTRRVANDTFGDAAD